jgi:hypothetical protein
VLLEMLRDEAGRADRPGAHADLMDVALLDAVFTSMDTMRGLLISAWHLPARQRDARWRRAREQLRAVFPGNERVRSAIAQATDGSTLE